MTGAWSVRAWPLLLVRAVSGESRLFGVAACGKQTYTWCLAFSRFLYSSPEAPGASPQMFPSEMRPKHPEEPFFFPFSLIHVCSFSRVTPETIWQTMERKKTRFFPSSPPTPICSVIVFYLIIIIVAILLGGFVSACRVVGVYFLAFLRCLRRVAIWNGPREIPPLRASNGPFTASLMTCQFPCPSIFSPINSFIAVRIKGDNRTAPPHNESLKFSSAAPGPWLSPATSWGRLLGMHAGTQFQTLCPVDPKLGYT